MNTILYADTLNNLHVHKTFYIHIISMFTSANLHVYRSIYQKQKMYSEKTEEDREMQMEAGFYLPILQQSLTYLQYHLWIYLHVYLSEKLSVNAITILSFFMFTNLHVYWFIYLTAKWHSLTKKELDLLCNIA